MRKSLPDDEMGQNSGIPHGVCYKQFWLQMPFRRKYFTILSDVTLAGLQISLRAVGTGPGVGVGAGGTCAVNPVSCRWAIHTYTAELFFLLHVLATEY